MPAAPIPRSIELSPQFFTTIFNDSFLFGNKAREQLKEANLRGAEKNLALKIRSSDLYSDSTWDECAAICNELSDVYHWQDNSDGPLVFAGKVLYLLRFKGEDVGWFRQQVQQAQAPNAKPRKKSRATVIVRTDEGMVITRDDKGLLLLPGGNVEPGELPIAAAARELYEETGLKAQALEFLFEEESEFYMHQVFLVRRYTGAAVAHSDALELLYLDESACAHGNFPERLSRSHLRIIQIYQRISSSN